MGNTVSKKSNHALLGIPETATLSETKKAFMKLMHQNKNDPEVLKAYDYCMNNINLDIYTKDLLDSDLKKYASDFFERISIIYKMQSSPQFLDSDFEKFYSFWSKFRSNDRTVESKVLGVLIYVKKMDPRMQTIIKPPKTDTPKKTAPKAPPTERIVKQKSFKFFCSACNSGFNNENTLNDHLKSKKHKSKISSKVDNSNRGNDQIDNSNIIVNDSNNYINSVNGSNNDSNSVNDSNHDSNSVNDSNHDSNSNIITNTSNKIDKNISNNSTGIVNHNTSYNTEHELYRTCHFCKCVFETRGKLIVHIKNNHS